MKGEPMKKMLAAIPALLAASAATADVRAGDIQDGTTELIFSYENPDVLAENTGRLLRDVQIRCRRELDFRPERA